MPLPHPWIVCAAALLALSGSLAQAQSSPLCASDGQPAPRTLTERFINADCSDCWQGDTPLPPHTAAVLDWVLPGQQGDDAPLSAVARREALQRLQFLGERVPDTQSSRSGKVQGGRHRVRVAHGLVLNDYVGASLRFTSRASLAEPLTGWLALVERLPAGTEGSPVPRVLVRNLLVEPIPARATGNMGQLWRPMNVPPGAQPDRLGVVGWVSDARGRVLAVAQSRCAPSAPDTPP
ncbi:MAG: hypothetical protein WBC18_07020 [Ottowia sp.]|uniref:hypothetical protein n=1 Tax=Ottowia sp. TaxID=1898956 RepID=UPI003C7588A6